MVCAELKWGRCLLHGKDGICITRMLIPRISSRAVFFWRHSAEKPAYGRADPLLHVSCRFNMIQSACNQLFLGKRMKVKRLQAVCSYFSAFWRELLISERTLLMLMRSASFLTLLSCCALGLLSPVCIPKKPPPSSFWTPVRTSVTHIPPLQS